MLKTLRIRFVCIVMTIVTIMICVIFGLVIHFTGRAMEDQSMRMMQAVAPTPGRPGGPGGPGSSDRNGRGEIRLPYFVIIADQDGALLTVEGYDAFVEEESLPQILEQTLAQGSQSGDLKEFDLRFWKNMAPNGQRIVFVDISAERATMQDLVQNCIVIGVISLLVFWGISILLARWAVRPVDQAWQQQKQFVADASHELKTPLTVIITNAELLQDPNQEEAAKRQFIASILTMSRQMRGLVEGLLELARVDNGAVKTNYSELDMSALAENALLPFEPLFFEKELTLSTSIEGNIRLKGSDTHLKQVLDILLDNVLKYSAPRGEVRVKLVRHGVHALLSVESPGEAISREDLGNIFKRFYRVDKARSRDGSYGLGLSIAQRIVQEHKGKIWAESGNGVNTFFVQLLLN